MKANVLLAIVMVASTGVRAVGQDKISTQSRVTSVAYVPHAGEGSIPTSNLPSRQEAGSLEIGAEVDTAVMQNAWFYYFSSLAQTIAAGSALLVALAVLRLQALENALYSIERTLGSIFLHIGKQDDYHSEASCHFVNTKWDSYFNSIETIAMKNKESFLASYAYSHVFVNSLLIRGRALELNSRKLHSALTFAFVGTVIFAGASILVLPLAMWITYTSFVFAWAISGLLLITLFTLYLQLLRGYIRYKQSRSPA